LPGLNSKLEGLKLIRRNTGFSKGVHLVTRQIEDHFALAVSSGKKTEGLVSRGGRHFFVIPWRHRSLIGTTNVPFTGAPEDVKVTAKDLTDFIRDINATFAGLNLQKSDIHFAFAGLYPLISEEIKPDTYQGTGEYQLVDHFVQDGVEGIVSVLGAKYTTARALAERAVDMLVVKLGLPGRKCVTGSEPLFEGRISDMKDFLARKKKEYQDILAPEDVEELIKSHGSEIDTVVRHLQRHPSFMEKISPERETFAGEIDYAVREEMACTLADVVFRRTGLGTIGHPGDKALNRLAQMMGDILAWDRQKTDEEIERVNEKYRYWEN
jgi:glycerol-3-phosphate dehydrogenase